VKLLYGAGTRLVMTSSEEVLPAPRRRRSRLGAVLHARDEDEADLLVLVFQRRGTWATRWAGYGLLLGCGAGAARGLRRQVRSR
jgi:hypothetical protein